MAAPNRPTNDVHNEFPVPEHLTPKVASSLKRYWRSNIRLMLGLLGVWLVAGLGCGVVFADTLNAFSLGGYPLGFWFAQQGAILVFVLIILVYALMMNRLDAKHHNELESLKHRSPTATQGENR